MVIDHSAEDETTARVRQMLADASIGRDVIFTGLADLQGIGDVNIADRTATVRVTLPIPSRRFRQLIEHEIRQTALGVDGITTVDCRFEPSAANPGPRVDFIPGVKNLIAAGSGKGGIGKSTIAVNLAVSIADAGVTVGLLDADVYGPNAPAMLGLAERTPDASLDDRMIPREAHGVKVMSMGFIVDEDDPVIWRGPLFDDVVWGDLEYLIVDLPPGTGDVQLSLVQHLPVIGAVVMTTPQPVAVDDARRSLKGFARYDVPILGIAENMSRFECPDCGTDHAIFDSGGADGLSTEFNVPVLGRIPIDPSIGTDESDEKPSESPGISLPGIGRLQLPRTREEREHSTADPIAARSASGSPRNAIRLLATRMAARSSILATSEAVNTANRSPDL